MLFSKHCSLCHLLLCYFQLSLHFWEMFSKICSYFPSPLASTPNPLILFLNFLMSHFAMSLTGSETVHYHFHLAYREISLPHFQYGMWFLFSLDNSGISDFIPSFIWNSFSEHEEHIIRNLINNFPAFPISSSCMAYKDILTSLLIPNFFNHVFNSLLLLLCVAQFRL